MPRLLKLISIFAMTGSAVERDGEDRMTKLKHKMKTALLVGLAVLLTAVPAQALLVDGFTCITNNNAGDCAIGLSQLSADITADVLTIAMMGTAAAVVEQVFIEGAGVTGITFTGNIGSGFVDFTPDGSPGTLPGGNSFFTTAASASANNPAPKFGIGFHSQDPLSGQSGAFTLAGELSDLRVGVHVIGYDSGGSESFVSGNGNGNGPPPDAVIPEPGTLLLLGSGLVGLGVRARRQRNIKRRSS